MKPLKIKQQQELSHGVRSTEATHLDFNIAAALWFAARGSSSAADGVSLVLAGSGDPEFESRDFVWQSQALGVFKF